MKNSVSLLSLVLCSAAVAQSTTPSALHTLTNYGNFGAHNNAVAFRTILAKKAIPAGHTTTVSATLPVGGPATVVTWNQFRTGVVAASVSEQGAVSVPKASRGGFKGGSTPSPSARGFKPGPHSLLLSIGGKPGSKGLLALFGSGVIARGVSVKYSVDIANDGRSDWNLTMPKSDQAYIPVKIPSGGHLLVKITSATEIVAAPGTSLRYKTGISVQFRPGPTCAVKPYGDRCGASLHGVFGRTTTGMMTFVLSYAGGRNAKGVMVFGTKFTHIPIAGSKCMLLTDPHVVVPFRTNSLGRAAWKFQFKPTDAMVNIQGADVVGRTLRVSNALHTVCVK